MIKFNILYNKFPVQLLFGINYNTISAVYNIKGTSTDTILKSVDIQYVPTIFQANIKLTFHIFVYTLGNFRRVENTGEL